MPKLDAIDPKSTTGKTKETLDAIEKNLGSVPNFFRTLAHSPAVIDAYLNFSQALSSGVLSPKVRELIILAVSETNQCNYCLAAHTAISQKTGLTEEEIINGRKAFSENPKIDAMLKFAKSMVEKKGWVNEKAVEELKEKGVSQPEITEIIANVSITLFTNYFNHIAQPEIDFPEIPQLSKE